MKHPSFELFVLISEIRETVLPGQFKWGTCLLKGNGGVYQGRLSPDGNRTGRVKAQAGLTARRICRAPIPKLLCNFGRTRPKFCLGIGREETRT